MSSVTLTTEEGTFEGTNQAEVSKAARKAKRAAKREEEAKKVAVKAARSAAHENGYKAYYRLHRGERLNWEVLAPDSPHFPPSRADLEDTSARYYRVEGFDGPGEFWLYNTLELVGVVWDGGGFPAIAFVREAGSPPLAYAMGVAQGECALVELPGITAEFFGQEGGAV